MKTCTLTGVQPTKEQAHSALRANEECARKLIFQWAHGLSCEMLAVLEVMCGSVSGDEFHFAGPILGGNGEPSGDIAVGHYNFRTDKGEVNIGQRSEIIALQTYTRIDLSPLR